MTTTSRYPALVAKSKTLSAFFLLSVALIVSSVASAEKLNFPPEVKKPGKYPERPVTMIVPFGTGGDADVLARVVAPIMGEIMGGAVQPVNMPGVGGLRAMPAFLQAVPDGYTILLHSDFPITAYAAGRLKEKIGSDFVPLCVLQVTVSAFFMRADEKRFSDWESLVKYAKKADRRLTIATSSSTGSHEHISIVQTSRAAGIELEIIPFGKPGERFAAVLGGHVDLLYEQPGGVMPHMISGDIVPILQMSEERANPPLLRGISALAKKGYTKVPSLRDVGYTFKPTFKVRGLAVDKDVPNDVRQYLAWACGQVYQAKKLQDLNKETFNDLVRSYYGPDETVKLTGNMIETYKGLYKEFGIRK